MYLVSEMQRSEKHGFSRSMTLLEVLHVGTQPPTLCLATCITLAGSYTYKTPEDLTLYNAYFK